MAEDTRAAEGQVPNGGEGQVPEDNAATQDASQEDATEQASQEEASSLEGLSKAELIKRLEDFEAKQRKVNKESESYRKRLRQYESQEEKRRKEQLSKTEALEEEKQTLQGRLEDLESQVKRANFERAFKLPDAELAYGIFGSQAEYDDALNVTNIDDIISGAKKQYPRVWGNGSANGGERSEPAPPGGSEFMNSLFRSGKTTRR